MAEEGTGDASSRKLHPFFVKLPAFAEPALVTAPPAPPCLEGHDAKRLKTNDYAQPYPTSRTAETLTSDAPHLPGDGSFTRLFPPRAPDHEPPTGNCAAAPFHCSVPSLFPPAPQRLDSDTNGTTFAVAAPPALAPTQPTLPQATSQATATRAPASQRPQLPTKVLKFNMKTGTLGSPPKPKPAKQTSKIVCIKYGQNPVDRKRIGAKIAQVLAGQLRIEEPTPKTLELKAKKAPEGKASQTTAKTTHPFFAKEKTSEPRPSSEKKRDIVFTSTPVSPKRPRTTVSSIRGPSLGINSVRTKVPGAKHPLWPPHGFSHVRGHEQLVLPAASTLVGRLTRKSKGQTVSIQSQESILELQGRQLNIQSIKRSLPKNDNTFPPPPAELRLPRRQFESGRKLAKRIRTQIQSNVSRDTLSKGYLDDDDLAHDPSKPVHPAVERYWESLSSELSAFDRSTCESAAWVSKYAPTTAAQVLQPGKEVPLLKQWLEMLRVQGVETAGEGSTKSKSEAKKKKRKSKLDGFIVDSEDESGEMYELSDMEDQPSNVKRRTRPSVVRSLNLAGKDPSKLANTLLISGPHGSGKSASVYAVAKDLGFEVFEINSSTRRSGKDILERVGDMTRNHLVQHHRAEAIEASADATESEISSGKQGTMTSFFKPKPRTEKKRKSHYKSRGNANKGAKGSSSKVQKQSLILLEEVDILFEEDKQFWASLQSLMCQSKRPFILTCNDESAVPINTLNLHGIFRFLPPPENLAVDVCLLIAANEGHALKQDAIRALYRCRDYDLRATITDLQFWCQTGVGDRRGGHDWFYLRWPKGIDVDKDGDVVRVISEDTYQTGMGWLSRDRIIAAPNTQTVEQETCEQAWQFWHCDLTDWHADNDLKFMSNVSSAHGRSRQQQANILDAYANYYDALSCADICAAGVLGVGLAEQIDPTLPKMTEGAKEDFVIGQALLEADPVQHQFCSRASIFSSLSALALGSLKHSAANSTPAATALPDLLYNEKKTTDILAKSFGTAENKLTRYDIAVAFDAIALSPKAVASMSLDPSVFDRTMNMIVVEVAPWIRGIVYYEDQLMQDRQQLNDLLSDGGRRKRMRTTRSAYSALEGGERRTTRRERYFGDCLETEAVLYTAGDGWQQALPIREKLKELEEGPTRSPM